MSTLSLKLSADGAGRTLAARMRAVCHAFRAARARRLSVRSLVELDDYILKDIGLTRADVFFPSLRPAGHREAGCRLKDWRRIATRFDRNLKNFMSAIALAAPANWWL